MKDYIIIPPIIKSINDDVHSTYLKKVWKESYIENNKVALNFIRSLYQENRELFFTVIEELVLRGFQFHTEKPNNVLRKVDTDFSLYLEVEEDMNRYSNIRWEDFGISGFNERFLVNNDKFFHKIPLNGFQQINRSLDLRSFMLHLKDLGFVIVQPQEETAATVEKVFHNEKDSQYSITEEEQIHMLKENTGEYEQLEDKNQDIPLHKLFYENKFNIFKQYCQENDLTKMSEINEAVIRDFSYYPGVGAKKILDVKDVLAGVTSALENEIQTEQELFIQINNSFIKNYKLADLFIGRKFNQFMEFCQQHSLTSIDDVTHRHMKIFKDTRGIGVKKYQSVVDVFRQLESSEENSSELFFITGPLFDQIKMLSLNELTNILNLDSLESCSTLTIGELEGKELGMFGGEKEINFLFIVSQQLRSIDLPYKIIDQVKEHLDERELNVLTYRLTDQLTLNETGIKIGVTRERARQLQKKAMKRTICYLNQYQFCRSLMLLNDIKGFVTETQLIQMIGEDNSNFVDILKEGYLYYEHKTGIFFLSEDRKKLFLSHLKEIVDELPEIFPFKEYEDSFKELENQFHLSTKEWKKVLKNFGYIEYGTILSSKKLNIIDMIELFFEDAVETSLTLDYASYERIRQYMLDYYEFPLQGSLRAFDARVRDAENIILVDSNTFQLVKHETIDDNLICQVDQFMQDRLQTYPVINVEEIFNAFEKDLANVNITNKIHLYSLIKYYFDDKYVVGKGNTLNIYADAEDKMNIEDRLVDVIRLEGGIATKKTIEDKLKWKRTKIDLGVSSSNKLLTWDRSTVRLFETIKMTDETKNHLLQLVDQKLSDGYTTSALIYGEMSFDRNLAPMLIENEISHHSQLASILKIIDSTIKGHNNFLYREGTSLTSFLEVLQHHFTEQFSRQELLDFIFSYGYKELMAYNFLNNLLEQDIITEIDIGVYYPTNKLFFPSGTMDALQNMIATSMGDHFYLSLSTLEGYRSELPTTNVRWTPHVIKSLLVKQGFKHIKRDPYNYRYDKLILVTSETKIHSFEELVYSILTNEYNGNMHETYVYDFLASKGLLDEKYNASEKILPNEIKRESEFVNVDELGIVTLKEDK